MISKTVVRIFNMGSYIVNEEMVAVVSLGRHRAG